MLYSNINGRKRITLVEVSSLYELPLRRGRPRESATPRDNVTRVSRHRRDLRLRLKLSFFYRLYLSRALLKTLLDSFMLKTAIFRILPVKIWPKNGRSRCQCFPVELDQCCWILAAQLSSYSLGAPINKSQHF